MFTQTLAVALAISAAFASPIQKRDACADACTAAYNTCRSAADANRATCASQYASCLGFSPFDAGGSLVTPTACVVGAAPGTPTTPGIPGGCNPAHPGSCPPKPSVTGIPGGCNPAHPGSCPPEYFANNAAGAPAAAAPSGPSGQVVPGASWTVKNLIRYCSDDNSGCDYNFDFSANDGSPDDRCTVIRSSATKNAATDSWYAVTCGATKALTVSWGFSAQFAVPFAVMTVVKDKKQAYFGVGNLNVGPVVPGRSPFGSGEFGNIGPQPVYYS